MRVLVTGATGLVGAHSARALLEAGHDVRLYVRNADMARDYFLRCGHTVNDVVIGDVRDGALVRSALPGCDGVLHAAALVSLDPRRAREIIANNCAGVRAVVGGAVEAGLRRIVYVSSLEVFDLRARAAVTEDSPLTRSRLAYSRSKRECEEYVRELQAGGAPVAVTYPAGVLGPEDPRLSEANRGLAALLATVPLTSTGMQVVDVRDLAQAHRWLLENPPPAGGARYIVGGRYLPWAELHAALSRLTGRRIPAPAVPGAVLRGIGHVIDVAKAIVPFDTQLSSETMAIATRWSPADSGRFTAASRMAFRPPEDTFAATIRWLAQAGHVPARLAGALAPSQRTLHG
jgi:dihydroflavonol-4-reductase